MKDQKWWAPCTCTKGHPNIQEDLLLTWTDPVVGLDEYSLHPRLRALPRLRRHTDVNLSSLGKAGSGTGHVACWAHCEVAATLHASEAFLGSSVMREAGRMDDVKAMGASETATAVNSCLRCSKNKPKVGHKHTTNAIDWTFPAILWWAGLFFEEITFNGEDNASPWQFLTAHRSGWVGGV